ncbi:MAG: hypothetical protein RL322_627 [Pseudomonadota bacterium]
MNGDAWPEGDVARKDAESSENTGLRAERAQSTECISWNSNSSPRLTLAFLRFTGTRNTCGRAIERVQVPCTPYWPTGVSRARVLSDKPADQRFRPELLASVRITAGSGASPRQNRALEHE